MAGLALVLELLSQKKQQHKSSVVNSFGSLSALTAASAAASAYGILPRYASRTYFRDFLAPVAFCEESQDRDVRIEEWKTDVYKNAVPKQYSVTLKPLFSAFTPAALSLTVTRALLLNFQPVIEQALVNKQEEEDVLEDEEAPPREPIDVKIALKRSGRSALREVTVVTVRRLLERLVLRSVSKRTSWKLLKDLQRSAERKAGRHLPKIELFLGVTKTTFRGHAVAISANWLVQLVLDIYWCIQNICQRRSKQNSEKGVGLYQITREEVTVLSRRIIGNTMKSGTSLALASVGAGFGAVIMRPALGQWIGLMIGETAGFIGMDLLIEPWIVFGTFTRPDVD